MIGCACDIRRGVTTNGGMQKLKLICVLMAAAFLPLMRVIPASAASREVENFCYEQLGRATLPLRPRGAGEAFMANCIAPATRLPIAPMPRVPITIPSQPKVSAHETIDCGPLANYEAQGSCHSSRMSVKAPGVRVPM
jgi:hypothetical protein